MNYYIITYTNKTGKLFYLVRSKKSMDINGKFRLKSNAEKLCNQLNITKP